MTSVGNDYQFTSVYETVIKLEKRRLCLLMAPKKYTETLLL